MERVPILKMGELLLVWPGRRFTRLATATMLWLSFAAAAAGAHGLVLDTFDPQWTSDLLADLKAQAIIG